MLASGLPIHQGAQLAVEIALAGDNADDDDDCGADDDSDGATGGHDVFFGFSRCETTFAPHTTWTRIYLAVQYPM